MMRIYNNHDMVSAVAHATRAGGQALWLDSQLGAGHLFDQDTQRLRETLVTLGVREVVIGHVGEPRQSALVQGEALRRAIAAGEAAGERADHFPDPTKKVGEGVGDES